MVRFTALIVLLWMGAPASAAWYEARSRHFIVYSEGSPASVLKFASDLERFDQGLRTLLSYADRQGPDPNPLTVFVVSDAGEVADLMCRGQTGDGRKTCKDIAGSYRSRVSGSVAFVPRRAGYGFDDARTVLFHEYAHHLMLANSGAAYPAWYREGFAEFVSYANLQKEGEVQIGLPANSRAYSLFQMESMPASEVLKTDMRKLSSSKRHVFYARAWLLTHYLTFAPHRRGQMSKYLNDINDGVPAAKAATAAYGDLAALDREVAAHLKRGRFHYLPVPVKPISPDAIAVRQLDVGETAMMPVRIKSTRGVNSELAVEVLAEARRIAAPHADSPGAQIALTEAELDGGNLDTAEAAIDRALTKASDDPRALIFKALILIARAKDATKDEQAMWREARKWLLKANQKEPDAAWPLFLYYQTFRQQGIKPTVNAVQALIRAFELVPQDGNVRMTVVNHCLAEDNLVDARTALAPLAYDPHLSPDDPAARLLALIDKGDKQAIRSFWSSGSNAQAD